MGYWQFTGGKKWNGATFVQNRETVFSVDDEADRVIPLKDEDLLLPGVLDLHTHIWAPDSNIGVSDVQLYSEGVVGCADGGSFGCETWAAANRYWKNVSHQQIRSFMSLLPEGLIEPVRTPTDPDQIPMKQVIEVVENAKKTEPGRMLGFKILLGKKSAEHDRKLLEKAREAADRTSMRIMVHVSGTYLPFHEIVEYLKRGDIITHPYSGFQGNILGADGKVVKAYFDGMEKELIMDMAHAGKHFSWKIYQQAISEGAMFDTISTDITRISFKEEKDWQLIDIFHLISAILNTGIDLDKVFGAVTSVPAKIMNIEMRSEEQILLLKKCYGEFQFTDGHKDFITGPFEYKPAIFIDRKRVILDRLYPIYV